MSGKSGAQGGMMHIIIYIDYDSLDVALINKGINMTYSTCPDEAAERLFESLQQDRNSI